MTTTPPRKRARRGPRLGAKSTCNERGACGANGAAPSAATRGEVAKPVLGPGAYAVEVTGLGALVPLDSGD